MHVIQEPLVVAQRRNNGRGRSVDGCAVKSVCLEPKMVFVMRPGLG